MSTSKYYQGKVRRFFIFLFLFSFFIISQSVTVFAKPEQWSSEVVVTTNSCLLKYPCIAVNNRVLHVVWLNEYLNTSEIWYTRSFDNGNTWGAMKKLTMNSSLVDTPQIAVNGKSVHMIWKDFRTGYPEILYKKSDDNGDTWTSDQQLTFNHSRSFDIYDLKLVTYHDTVHMVWKDYRHGSSEIYYKNSDDNGDSWEPDQRLTHDYIPSYSPCIALDQHTVYITWDNWGDTTEIWFKRSDDNGKTWSNTTILSSEEPAKNSWITSDKVFIHVVWQEDHNGTWDIYYKNSGDEGRTWSHEQRLTFHTYDCFSPKILSAADTMYVFWQEIRKNNSVFVERHSSDNGMNWSEEVFLTDENTSAYEMSPASNGHTQFLIWQYSSELNQICYRKKSETNPIVTDISIDNTTLTTQHHLLISVDGGDSLYNNSALTCLMEWKQSLEEYAPVETIFTNNHWESVCPVANNGNDGDSAIRAKLITPDGKESRWYTTTTSIQFSDTSNNYVSGFEFLLIISSLSITIGIYILLAKGGKP
jgi:Neuraminidase (sialidase)